MKKKSIKVYVDYELYVFGLGVAKFRCYGNGNGLNTIENGDFPSKRNILIGREQTLIQDFLHRVCVSSVVQLCWASLYSNFDLADIAAETTLLP